MRCARHHRGAKLGSPCATTAPRSALDDRGRRRAARPRCRDPVSIRRSTTRATVLPRGTPRTGLAMDRLSRVRAGVAPRGPSSAAIRRQGTAMLILIPSCPIGRSVTQASMMSSGCSRCGMRRAALRPSPTRSRTSTRRSIALSPRTRSRSSDRPRCFTHTPDCEHSGPFHSQAGPRRARLDRAAMERPARASPWAWC